MTNTISTENDFEPAYIGYFFILFSGLTAFVIALFVWIRWDTDRKGRNGRQGYLFCLKILIIKSYYVLIVLCTAINCLKN